MSKGQELWKQAKHLIPGGNMLLSKRPEMFLPEQWPVYYSKSKGCNIWDLDGNKLTDMSVMSVGTNILGYGHEEIDEAVKKTIENGNMSTLNCPEEVWLAEKLVDMHPWADMIRFARSGGEANAISIRIARAATGRETVAICGYHGWHDWYLATNLKGNSELEEHLLPGLEPNGVPEGLTGTVKPFSYNNFDQLKNIAEKHKLAAVKMEVERSEPPKHGFLQKVRKLCSEKGIVLIFDECTSGFREQYGGLHLKYGVEPDMAMFGKALGNGYAVTAALGKKSIMEAAQNTFISSTFWTERIGPTAAIKTLEIMEREKSWLKITEAGKRIRKEWVQIGINNGLEVVPSGIPALSSFTIKSKGKNMQKYKTLISQEMLKEGYLAATTIYLSISHTSEVIDGYMQSLDKIFKLIGECENEGRNINDLLNGPICHNTFNRLN